MNITLISYEVIDNFDNMDYIRYKYQIDKNKNLLEINLNDHRRDVVNNFVYGIANLYQSKNIKVRYKNKIYKLYNQGINEYDLW